MNRSAIIDIGSNSIRLVVYQGHARLPATIFNEKVMAGLGAELSATGRIAPEAIDRAVRAVTRFVAIAREMAVAAPRAVATAAVREAENGEDLLDRLRRAGVRVELLAGEQEALAAGLGVVSAFPDADGIVADLGGGSLELARVRDGEVLERASFPLGVLRVAAIRAKGKGTLNRTVARALRPLGWVGTGAGLPLYLVGGSWRALARYDIERREWPLPLLHGYCMDPEGLEATREALRLADRDTLKRVRGISSGRAATLADGAALLSALIRALGSVEMRISTFGLREGLLFAALPPKTRAEDPLIVAAREDGRQLGRFDQHGDLTDRWLAAVFDDAPPFARLRLAACLLADTAWRANPDFRAELGVETALHGSWVAIDGTGRALLAQALHTTLGGSGTPAPLALLAKPAELEQAIRWGLAIRLAQRLSGGIAGPLERSTLSLADGEIRLELAETDAALYGETVARRHKALAEALGGQAVLVTRSAAKRGFRLR